MGDQVKMVPRLEDKSSKDGPFFLQMKSEAPFSLLNYEKTSVVMKWFRP